MKNISIPNMLTRQQVYHELLCEAASPENIVRDSLVTLSEEFVLLFPHSKTGL
ncbi:MAG: hypothetical protein IJS39_11550 [Synergistaceae bacterium]|nr:hypothetical protein [Synergistaceae bacterium]